MRTPKPAAKTTKRDKRHDRERDVRIRGPLYADLCWFLEQIKDGEDSHHATSARYMLDGLRSAPDA